MPAEECAPAPDNVLRLNLPPVPRSRQNLIPVRLLPTLPPNVSRFSDPKTYMDALTRQAQEVEACHLLGQHRAQMEARKNAPPSPEMEMIVALVEALDERTPSGRRVSGNLWYRTLNRLTGKTRPAVDAAINSFCRVGRLDRAGEAK